MEIDKELDNTILNFADIQSELNLRHAREALRDIVEKYGFDTPRT